MEKLKVVLDITSIILSIITVVILLATWNKTPEILESEE